MNWEEVVDQLRSALIVQCHAHNKDMQKGNLCWCALDYDFEKYGHSIACVAAKEALQAIDDMKNNVAKRS